MAYAKINSITNANMAKVLGREKANLRKIHGKLAPAAGFTDAKSLDFDGSDDHVLTDLEFVNRNVTMSCWVKQDTAEYNAGILGDMTIGRSNILKLDTWFSGGLWIRIGDGSGSYSSVITGFNIADGNWHHVVFMVGGDNAEDNIVDIFLWVDGVLRKNTANYNLNKNSATAEFGMGYRHPNSGQGSIAGNINDVAVWQDQLSTAEVVEIYNSGAPTDLKVNTGNYSSASDLIGYWKMGDGDTYPTIVDHSGSNNGTMTNMTSGDIVTDVP